MESTLHTLHSLVSSLDSISFSKFDFLSYMGGSAPLTPNYRGRVIVKQVCSLVRDTVTFTPECKPFTDAGRHR